MNWRNTAFKFKDIAELTKQELEDAGIKTDLFRTGDDDYWYVGWLPTSKEQEQKGTEIICQHIW